MVLQSHPEAGGANHYEKQLAGILRDQCAKLGIEFVIFSPPGLVADKNTIEIVEGRLDNLKLSAALLLPRFLTKKMGTALEINFSKQLSENEISVVYFASPNKLALSPHLPPTIVTTIWDLGHREQPFLPETFYWGRWVKREFYFCKTTSTSTFIVTDSQETKRRICEFYRYEKDSIFPVGLLPINHAIPTNRAFLQGRYFIYPAQKWRHKNHDTILRALKIVAREAPDVKLVLTGSDKGDGARISRKIKRLGLSNLVIDLGFVHSDDLVNLQYHAKALLMPSLIGPTNIPPLDALSLSTPPLISDVHHFDSPEHSFMKIIPSKEPRAWAREMLAVLASESKPDRVVHDLSEARRQIQSVLERLKNLA